mgnify:FL=1
MHTHIYVCMYVCRKNHLCSRLCLIDVGCQTIRHVETDINRSIDREKENYTDSDLDNYTDKKNLMQNDAIQP